MPEILDIKLISETKSGTLIKVPAKISRQNGRIIFVDSPFALKDEIKAMKRSRWHPKEKYWSVEDCQRNWFQLKYMMGENPYEWFDREIETHEYERPLMSHQKEMVEASLTYRYQIWAVAMGAGKSLAAIEHMERSGIQDWVWVGPKPTLPAIKLEFKKWNLTGVNVELVTYDKFKSFVEARWNDRPIHGGMILDEVTRCKSPSSGRAIAAQRYADLIRQYHQFDGSVIGMTGTPAPKKPTDWWSICEIVWPGFLREGSIQQMERRLSIQRLAESVNGHFSQRVAWLDDERRCNECGEVAEHADHHKELVEYPGDYHTWVPSKNEVAFLYERLQGLAIIKHKKDCLELPDKIYRTVNLKPSSSTLRLASALKQSSPDAMSALSKLRELSDGFQYQEKIEGKTKCNICTDGTLQEFYHPDDEDFHAYDTPGALDFLDPEFTEQLEKRTVVCHKCDGTQEMDKIVRFAREIPTPKEQAVIDLLDENDHVGRLIIFAGFTGSIDRIVRICTKHRWDVVRLDGRGWQIFQVQPDGEVVTLPRQEGLDYWSDLENNNRVAFVSHPESGGQGLTLTEACMEVFYSNSFKPEYRIQAEDRIHRPGMDENRGATIVDLCHLPTDDRVLEIIRENRRLELMTMGEVFEEVELDSVG